MLIGLTGQIGSGKSTAARVFEELGAAIVDADMIGRDVVEMSPAVLKKLTKQFGIQILTPSGSLNRRMLARRAFASDESKVALNAIVHPYLLDELHRQVKGYLKQGKVVVIDAALLLDWDLDKQVDKTLVITASPTIRVKRMEARGLSHQEVLDRQKVQLPLAEYKRRATDILTNNGTREELARKVTKLWQRWFPKAA
ncbi:MAG: dephospho-CoA kinase [bacterium]|nr:dephospho-CoA kinase [bacterium]